MSSRRREEHEKPDAMRDFLLEPSIRSYSTPRGRQWPGFVVHAFMTLRFGEVEMAKTRSYMDQRVLETAREKVRAQHVLKAMKSKGIASEIRDAFVRARFGGDAVLAKKARKGKLEADPHAGRARDSMARYAPRSIEDQALKDGNPYIKRTAKFRASCKHRFKRITEEWSQCKRCAWCKPRIPEDEMLRLPPILEGRDLPPLSEDQQWVNMRNVNTLAGIVLSKRVRAEQVQYSFETEPYIKRYGLEVRFKSGWREAGVFFETAWYRLVPVLQQHAGNPKKLWRAVQKELNLFWWPPWQMQPYLRALGVRLECQQCSSCSFTKHPVGYCKHHFKKARKVKM